VLGIAGGSVGEVFISAVNSAIRDCSRGDRRVLRYAIWTEAELMKLLIIFLLVFDMSELDGISSGCATWVFHCVLVRGVMSCAC
jgi:hypothetical protein